MADDHPRGPIDRDREVVLFILSVAVGAVVSASIMAAAGHNVFGEALAFFGMWMAMYPFSRQSWAAKISFSRYLASALVGTAIAAVVRILLH